MNQGPSRREVMRLSAAGLLGTSVSGWLDVLAARAAQTEPEPLKKRKSCILLYMNGGPSHVDTFDPKPGNGEFKAIDTAAAGVKISEHFPLLAKQMDKVALLRGMSTGEGSHARARYLIHTGYREGVGGVIHPSLGAIASAESGNVKPEMPNFVSISGGSFGSGYLGPFHSPLIVTDPAKGVENLKPSESFTSFDRRVALLDEMEQGFLERKQTPAVAAHKATYQSAFNLIHSQKVKAFDIAAEPKSVRDAYGTGKFGEGCLLARRLVEIGVPFVEVNLGGWDTHKQNFDKVKNLSAMVDPAASALLSDLKSKGLLDSTLVVWMGDFGRTPDIKDSGRGHYPKAWTTWLAGAGLKTGQAIGKTDKHGGTVEERPTSVQDFLSTVCKALGIDYTKSYTTRDGRPMRIVDKGEKPIKELFA